MITRAKVLIELAEGLESQLKSLNAEAAESITKDGDSPIVVGNNLGVKYMKSMAEVNAAYAIGKLVAAAELLKEAIDERTS